MVLFRKVANFTPCGQIHPVWPNSPQKTVTKKYILLYRNINFDFFSVLTICILHLTPYLIHVHECMYILLCTSIQRDEKCYAYKITNCNSSIFEESLA